nr:hypothetical protein CFP56_31686 [Quercus suber]
MTGKCKSLGRLEDCLPFANRDRQTVPLPHIQRTWSSSTIVAKDEHGTKRKVGNDESRKYAKVKGRSSDPSKPLTLQGQLCRGPKATPSLGLRVIKQQAFARKLGSSISPGLCKDADVREPTMRQERPLLEPVRKSWVRLRRGSHGELLESLLSVSVVMMAPSVTCH